MKPWVSMAAALLLAAALAGCGYHTAGHANQLPADTRTIAIPAFVNRSQTYRIEQTLTEAVVREFVTRTTYHVENQPMPDADLILKGTVDKTEFSPITYDSSTGRASTALVTIHLKVSLVDRRGKVLYDNPSYLFRQQYQLSREASTFFEESSPAMDRLSRDFAHTLVSNILEAF